MRETLEVLGYVIAGVLAGILYVVGIAMVIASHAHSAQGATFQERFPIQNIDISDDPGGLVSDYARWYIRLKVSGIHVRITGECTSACTVVLLLPRDQVCVTPHASLGFHLAATPDHPDGDWDMTELFINTYYTQEVKDWLQDKTLTLDHITRMYAPEIVSRGIFPPCQD